MPVDYKLYPPDWKTVIRPAILERDGHKCKFCGVENYAEGYRDNFGDFHTGLEMLSMSTERFESLFDELTASIKIILTIAHLDHNINNNDYSNLAALCQRCHFAHDRQDNNKRRKANERKKRYANQETLGL